MIICITNRKLCNINFLDRIEILAKQQPSAIILREKDLSLSEYTNLAQEIKKKCDKYGVPLIINYFIETAEQLDIKNIHLPLSMLIENKNRLNNFNLIGTSIHSVDEAITAQSLGVNYIIAGHIFKTDCKKNLPPRGLDFLTKVCKNVNIPIFAIGGIDNQNTDSVLNCGAKGVCIMSSAMNGSYNIGNKNDKL